jgi:hypothetical protein
MKEAANNAPDWTPNSQNADKEVKDVQPKPQAKKDE